MTAAGGEAGGGKKRWKFLASRREVREAAVVAVFAALSGGGEAAAAVEGVKVDLLAVVGRRHALAVGDALFVDLIRVFDFRRAEIEDMLEDAFGRPLEQMTRVEWAVAAVATAELLGWLETPRRVIIDEAIEIAKRFGAEGGGALVNGVVNEVARRVRGE